MRLSLVLLAAACAACGRAPAPPLNAQVSGTMTVNGLAAPVRIIRDRWGVPHIYADSRDDVFFAQGFVQAQDRLFQMELWRRSSEGRLSEVFGANFIERDAMTRRLQYQGDLEAEWASYGPDARAIGDAFVRGINAWVALARERSPELFAVAGWPPVFWSAVDLLTRTDAFDRDATIKLAEQQGLPALVVDAVRRAAAPPFFTGLARPPQPSTDASGASTTPDAVAALDNPSRHYLIHLHTPNWNAIGAAVPWRPGIVVGHDASVGFRRPDRRVAASVRAITWQPSAGRILKDAIGVKGRTEPFVAETQITPEGVVIATDRSSSTAFVLSWPGHTRGAAPAFVDAQTAAAAPHASTADPQTAPALATHPVYFSHPLAITAAARARFNIGPIAPPADGATPFYVGSDANVWDASPAMNAPGQSEDPASAHFADLARLWAAGQTLTLAYSDEAVKANAEATLTLVPDRRR